jgi:hypothetical protein
MNGTRRVFPVSGAVLALLVHAGCESAGGLKVLENPPSVVIVEPVDGETFEDGDSIRFLGLVDSDFSAGDLTVTWNSDADGEFLDSDPPDPDGYVEFVTRQLSAGPHVITLRAIDSNAEQGEDFVEIEVVGGPVEEPSIAVTHPTVEERGLTDTPFIFGAFVEDFQDDPTDLYVEVSESSSGLVCEMFVDSGGNAQCEDVFAAGNYSLTYLVRDTDGNTATASASFSVVDPDDYDFDGDGISVNGGDCNDGNITIYPGAPEVCDYLDNNCNDQIDEGVLNVYYLDEDGDGWGVNTAYVEDCTPPVGYAADMGDCDDTNRLVNPDAVEVCDDGIDNNCDGALTERNASGCTYYYTDSDGDSYGSGSSQCWCAGGSAPYTATNNTDCYDTNADVNPGQSSYFTYQRGDGSFDYNCNGAEEEQYLGSTSGCDWGIEPITCGLNGSAGWDGSAPACGGSGQWNDDCDGSYDALCYALCLLSSDPVTCLLSCTSTCDMEYTAITQSCR